MKKLLFTLAVAALSLSAASAEEKTKVHDFGDIRSLEVSYLFDVHVTEGNSDKVTVIYEEEYEKHLKVRYHKDGAKLRLELNDIPNKFKRGNQPHITVYLQMNDIDDISLSGASSAEFEGKFKSTDLYVGMSGATKLKGLQVRGSSLKVECSGASKANLSGSFTEEIEVNLSGASDLICSLDTDRLEGELSGASKFTNEGNVKDCEIEASGASRIDMTGSGESIEIQGSGATSLNLKDFPVMVAHVELSGASKASVNASKTMRHDVSRASKMTYYGEAELQNLNEDSNIVRGR